jgi:hypothetical protein
MVTFLNSVRDLRPNGLEMFNCADYVLLGHNAPSKQWEQRIATSLIESMKKENTNWLNVFGPNLSPELVSATLRSKPELFTVRPALIHQLLQRLTDSNFGDDIQTRLAKSLLLVESKLKDESRYDFLLSLQALRDQHRFLASMRKLSDGVVADGVEAAKLFGGDEKMSKFAALLCGLPDWVGAVRPTLQAPYAEYCRDFITAVGGSFAVNVSRTEAAGVKVKLIDRFKSSLTLFGQCHNLFYKHEAQLISDSIVDVLFQANIGIDYVDGKPLKPVRSMFDHPLLQQVYEQSKIGHEQEYQQHLKQYKQWKNNGCCGPPPNSDLLGFLILRALRNLVSHSSDYTELLMLMGWRPSDLSSIVFAFEERAKETPWGFFYSDDEKCFKLTPHLTKQARKAQNNCKLRPVTKPRP